MSTKKLEALLRLADAYADASFEQGLEKRTLDDAPENARSALETELRRLHAENSTLRAGYDAARLEIESLRAINLELERLCDATYVAQGADAYNHACEQMERYQKKRDDAGKVVGTERSLCDGLAWLYGHIAGLESQLDAAGAAPVAWQCRHVPGPEHWWECTQKVARERAKHVGQWEVRALYAAPQPAAQALDAQTNLGDLDALAKQFASSYASPHHFTLSVAGLRKVVAAIAAQQGGQ